MRRPTRPSIRNWANSVLQHALDALEHECVQRGRGDFFRAVKEFLAWDAEPRRIDATARALGMTAGALRVAIHRLRLAFRRRLEEQVAHTVASAEELREELQHLRRSLGA